MGCEPAGPRCPAVHGGPAPTLANITRRCIGCNRPPMVAGPSPRSTRRLQSSHRDNTTTAVAVPRRAVYALILRRARPPRPGRSRKRRSPIRGRSASALAHRSPTPLCGCPQSLRLDDGSQRAIAEQHLCAKGSEAVRTGVPTRTAEDYLGVARPRPFHAGQSEKPRIPWELCRLFGEV
jgi:hypothetical protein